MQMTSVQALITILAIAAGTQFTRWLPFWLFPEKKDPPAVVLYLGKVLPPAMMGLLTVYCFKNVSWLSGTHGAPSCWPLLPWWGCICGNGTCCSLSPGARRCTWFWCRPFSHKIR